MFSGIRSRSHSREKKNELINTLENEEDVPQRENLTPRGRATPESTQWDDMGLDHTYDPSFLFTQDHPIGNILLKQQADITKLAEKIKMHNMTTNVNELCSSFTSGIELERAKTVHSIAQSTDEMEEKIISKELKAHHLENAVEPPVNFSTVPTLVNNASKLNECLKVFARSTKFSGAPGTLSVVEFLTNLTLAQEQCNLSEKEFLDRMLASCTGRAHELMLMWLQNKCSAAQIYASLLIHYDKRPNVDEAKRNLYNYKVFKHEDLATAEGKIMIWVGQASKTVPVGPSRNTYSDLEGCQALIRALPEWSSMSVENLYKSLSAKLGRALTFNELDQALHALRPNIDRDIKQHGWPPKYNANNKARARNAHTSYSLEIKPNVDTVATKRFPQNARERTATSFTPSPSYTNRNPSSQTSIRKPIRSGNNVNRRAGTIRTSRGGIFNNRTHKNSPRPFVTRNQSNNNNTNGNRDCILCGFRNHKAEDCRNMRDDKGNIVKVVPQYGSCTACPANVQQKLRHPLAFCPFRPLGPLHGRSI